MEGPTGGLIAAVILCLQIVWSSSSSPSNDSTSSFLCHPSQSFALLQFKGEFAINRYASPNYYCDEYSGVTSFPKTNSWREGTDCCLWEGVECDESTGNVIGLDLIYSWLYGQFHANTTLFQLSHLQAPSLACNDFYGSMVSSELVQLVNLTHLNISNSFFAGMIPSQLFYLSKLVSLDFTDNTDLILDTPTFEMLSKNLTRLRHLSLDGVSMSAVNPKSFLNLSTSLESLSLSHCQLGGKFPVNVFNLVYLKKLIVSYNWELVVTLPKSNWSVPLEMLDLSNTSLSLKLPYSAVNLKSLKSLTLENCGLQGLIPSFISNLTQITHLSLKENNLTGELPSFFSNLKHLTQVILSYNKLEGQLPNLFGNLTKLTFLQLHSNNLQGHSPLSIFSHPQLSWLSLYENELVSLPSDVSNLSKLTDLSLGSNKLNGTIPSWLFNLSSLTWLDLSDNQLTGKIPDFKSKSLSFLALGDNMLHGRIPETIICLVNLIFLYLNSNKISGTIPPWLLSMPMLQYLDLQNNQLTREIPEFLSKSFNYINFGQNMLHGRIPDSMFQLENLTALHLSSNSLLFGTRDLNRFQKLKNLRDFDLSYTNLSIPTTNTFDLNWPRLKSLYLSSCNVSGFPNFLRTQDELEWLDLSNNNIRGDIPRWVLNVGKETLWVLNLSHNNLTGSVQLFWQRLRIVDLNSNMFQGMLPILPPHLTYFSVSRNNFSGKLSSLVCNMSSLQILDLSHKKFSFTIPSCVGNLTIVLSVLNLQMNSFHGMIPAVHPQKCRLRNLNLQGNQLEGQIPSSLANCKDLEVVDLGRNMFNDEFPDWLENLPILRVLVLRSNKLHGPLSNFLANVSLSRIQVLDQSSNALVGNLPMFQNLGAMVNVDVSEDASRYLGTWTTTGLKRGYDYSVALSIKGYTIEMQKIFHVFTSIDLSNNSFEGEIPNDIGKLLSLKGLNLSHNILKGRIPPSVGNLTKLEWLDLSSNKLIGEIPMQLVDVTSLAILNLSDNQLVGHIPEGKQFNTLTIDSYVGNLGLCGYPLPRKCRDEERKAPVASLEDGNSSFFDHGFGWQIVAVGQGFGGTFGVGVGYIMFRYPRPRWLLLIVEDKLRLGPRRKRNSWRRNYKFYTGVFVLAAS